MMYLSLGHSFHRFHNRKRWPQCFKQVRKCTTYHLFEAFLVRPIRPDFRSSANIWHLLLVLHAVGTTNRIDFGVTIEQFVDSRENSILFGALLAWSPLHRTTEVEFSPDGAFPHCKA